MSAARDNDDDDGEPARGTPAAAGTGEGGREMACQIAELQVIVAELRTGLMRAMQDLSDMQHGDRSLERKMKEYQEEIEDKLMTVKNSLNTLKGEVGYSVKLINELSARQRELQRTFDVFQFESDRDLLLATHRKSQREEIPANSDLLLPSQPGLRVIQKYFSRVSNSPATEKAPGGDREEVCQEGVTQRGFPYSPVWPEKLEPTEYIEGLYSKDNKNAAGEYDRTKWSLPDGEQRGSAYSSKRQTAALEILESERAYVSHLSLLLQANIAFNGSETAHTKDKRPFPTCLRFLIQHHLDLLHVLQDRVLKRQWQGIVGDLFMKLTSKQSHFLKCYTAYLKELPNCLSVVNICAGSLKSFFLEEEASKSVSCPSVHMLLLRPAQRIQEYAGLVQDLFKQTEPDHPDFYLLPVCSQQLSAFVNQSSDLLQHAEDARIRSKRHARRQNLTDGSSWTAKLREHPKVSKANNLDSECRKPAKVESLTQSAAHNPEHELRTQSLPMQAVPEKDPESTSIGHHLGKVIGNPASEPLVLPYLDSYLVEEDELDPEGLFEEGDSLQNLSLFDNCSSVSSSSSPGVSLGHSEKFTRHSEMFAFYPETGQLHTSPPLQVTQRKSKSLNGLQLDSLITTDSSRKLALFVNPHSSSDGIIKSKVVRHPPKPAQTPKSPRTFMAAHKIRGAVRTMMAEEKRTEIEKQEFPSVTKNEKVKASLSSPEKSHAKLTSSKSEPKGFKSSFRKLFKMKSSGGNVKEKSYDRITEGAMTATDEPSTPMCLFAQRRKADKWTPV
ncbi:rho guanine nucleotide exchange factor 33 isoform X1 [Erpetoichthys calabaricus]|uniref:rho guanine nucleotide exchange factor 33 isoform X1 n=1 Tax=Erpetoichthys calabaricus TaxID=27687 RepID=UPI002233ECED|nr:rho guanine nucleotide exchange factor 33 isoform X1 [Erpetoichthys calabaricus]